MAQKGPRPPAARWHRRALKARWWLVLALPLLLAACAAPPPPANAMIAPQGLHPYRGPTPVSCVPFARAVSGIDLHGDAWTWWQHAAGRYARGQKPEVGAVLTLKRTSYLPQGHVGVVAELIGPREILVTQSNWGSHGAIHLRQPVRDVSSANDWSEVEFMNRLGSFGRPYPAFGFIYPASPAPGSARNHEQAVQTRRMT